MTQTLAYMRIVGESFPHPVCGGVTAPRATTRGGYIQVDVGRGRRIYAHRLAWEAHKGSVPDGLSVLHRCDQPSCFDVGHLFLGTIADNNADRDAKGRGVVPDTRGTRHGMHKLSDEQVIEIYRSSDPGKLLAARYGVAPSCITKIRRGYAWRHLTANL
jgi:hypothetical protein